MSQNQPQNQAQQQQQSALNDILMHLSPQMTASMSSSQLRRHTILFEFKLVQTYGAQIGTYLIPQLDDINKWHGIIFVRNGLYKNGKFKFQMDFPPAFPLEPPQITFKQAIFHPLIHPETGKLHVEKLFKEWRYGSTHLVYTMVNEIKNIFLDINYFSVSDSLNPIAAKTFSDDIEGFYKNVLECVQHSIDTLYVNEDPKCTLKFTEFNSTHEQIRDSLSTISADKNLSFDDKKKQFMKYLLLRSDQGQQPNNMQGS